jgi:hypothetical protein
MIRKGAGCQTEQLGNLYIQVCIIWCFSFRDRRYEYKGLNKLWKGKLAEANKGGDKNPMKIQEAQVLHQ